jgi:single-strand DNA-binding protein
MINNVTLVGRLGQNPQTNSDTGVTTVSLATNRRNKGEEIADWHNLVFFGDTATKVAEFGKRGGLVAVIGELRYNSWVDKSGTKRVSTEVVCSRFRMLDPKNASTEEKFQKHPTPSATTFDDVEGDTPF